MCEFEMHVGVWRMPGGNRGTARDRVMLCSPCGVVVDVRECSYGGKNESQGII